MHSAIAASVRPLRTLLGSAGAVALAGIFYAIATGSLRHPLPLDPAAGIALACAIVYGRIGVAGVLLGSIAMHLALRDLQVEPDGGLALAIGLGTAAALQAGSGGWLVRRHVGQPMALSEPRDIARFFLLGAAAAAGVGTLAALAALHVAGVVAPGQIMPSGLGWWSGEVLGVLLVAPIALSLVGQPRSEWAPRQAVIGASLLTLLTLLSVVALEVHRLDKARAQARFERDAMAAAATLEQHLQRPLLALEAMHGIFAASEEVTRDEWRRAASSWLSPSNLILALGWSERVPVEQIGSFESRMRAQGLANYRVRSRDRALPPGADVVYAITYIESQARNAGALGVDALSIPQARAAIERGIASGGPAASAGFRLSQDRDDENRLGIVVYRAVMQPPGAGAGIGSPLARGVVFATLRVEDVLASAFTDLPEELAVCVLDITDGAAAPRALAGAADCTRSHRFSHEKQLAFADRTWSLRIASNRGFAPAHAIGNPVIVSVVGIALAAMLGALLLGLTGRARRIEAAVAERTAALTDEVRDRELAEAALRESEQRFRNIFDTVPIGVAYADLDGQLQHVNPQFCRLTGYGKAELLRMNRHDYLHPGDVASDGQLTAALLRGELPMHRSECRVVRKDGEIVQVRTSLTLLRDADGAPRRLVGVMEDISDHLRRVEAERAREQAENANLAKNEFLSRMSHELRTPLNAMLGFAQLLELDARQPLPESQRNWVAQIQQAGWHLLDMINDVLDLSRIESGNLRLQTDNIDLEALVGASLAFVEGDAARRGILIRCDFGASSFAVRGDITRVKQILLNLLSNAIKYNIDYGKIEIRTSIAGERIEVAVSDSGLGMDAAQLAGLFQPFNRLGRERSGLQGTGIGLVISKRLAECMGGDLRVQSSPGEGSTFILALPFALAADTVRDDLAHDPELNAGYHRRIVHYIEDNETNVEVMRGIVAQRPQVRMSVSITGEQARTELRRERPDIILLDMNLPDIDGLELLRQIKADPALAAVPLIVVSADALQVQIDTAMAAGAMRYLTKPVNVSEVLRVLDELLDIASTRYTE